MDIIKHLLLVGTTVIPSDVWLLVLYLRLIATQPSGYDCSIIKMTKEIHGDIRNVEINSYAQDRAAPAQSARPANWHLDNFPVLINPVLDQKHSISSQLIPKHQANTGPFYPKESWLCGPSKSDIFYFCLPCSSFFILKKLPAFHPILQFPKKKLFYAVLKFVLSKLSPSIAFQKWLT